MQPCSLELTAMLSPERKNQVATDTLQPGGAKRFSEHCCRSWQYKLQLTPVAWAGTQHGSAAMVVRQSAFQTEKQGQGAWSPPPTSQSSPPLNSGCISHYLQIREWVQQKHFFPE